MKRLFTLLLLLTSLFASSQTDVYHPFPDSNAVWNFRLQAYCFLTGISSEYYSITFNGDTIIGGQAYHKLTTPFVEISTMGGGCSDGYPLGYQGAIRQDISNKKVYFVEPLGTTESLLYDFNLEVGDTVNSIITIYNEPKDTVISIDSVLVGNSYRKRWFVNQWYNIYFIEGIGSTYGFFQFSPGSTTDLPDFSLSCFQQDGQTLYPNTNTACELIISPTNQMSTPLPQLNVFPNPSNGSFTIDLQNTDIQAISITDLLGKTVLRKTVGQEQTIEINGLQTGTFVLSATDNQGRTTNAKLISCPQNR